MHRANSIPPNYPFIHPLHIIANTRNTIEHHYPRSRSPIHPPNLAWNFTRERGGAGGGGPRLTLAFYRQQVNKGLIRELPSTSPTEDSLVSSTRLGLTLRLERHHFPGGTLTITCQSTLPRIRGDRALERVETATLAASNQRLAQEPPRSGSTIDAQPVSISICCLLAILSSFNHGILPLLHV